MPPIPPPPPDFFFRFLHLFFFFLFFIHSNADPELGTASLGCPSSTCNGVNIAYPFWPQDSDEPIATSSTRDYCGYPGFGISCSTVAGELPILHTLNDAFIIRNIDYANRNVILVDLDVTGVSCPRARNNLTIEPYTPLYNSGSNLNLSFYYNCTSELPFAADPLPCLQFGTNESYVLRPGNNEQDDSEWFRFCGDKVVVPVMQRAVNTRDSLDGQFAQAMNRGFVLDWGTMENCSACEASDGRCGYRATMEFVCICSDGTTRPEHCRGEKANLPLKIGIGFGAAGFSIFIMCLIFFFYYRRNKKKFTGASYMFRNISSQPSSLMDLEKAGTYRGVPVFKYSELEKATNNFDSKKELGDGGFGTVYHGKLQDGRVVAVKRLYENNYRRVEQFMNEVEILTRLQHPNLVRLYGCTSHHCRELLLVYEYIPNGTVADHLHGELAKPGTLAWATRLNIAVETASALAYLHTSDVIHRDVKTNNILLDNHFSVKVADFGLSRLFPTDVTHVSTAPQGTPGYVDPEYHECYQLTDKSDVYSFGVVLIELISSQPAVDITRHRHEINLSNMAINKIRNDALHELLDPNLGYGSDYKVRKMIKAVAELAFQCLQNEREMRPKMDEVLEALKGIQGENYDKDKQDKSNIAADDAVLLKNNPQSLSPDSVVVTWTSSSTTSNSSA